MFDHRNNVTPEELNEFIETRPQSHSPDELRAGVGKILLVLDKNPEVLMDVLKNHPFTPAIFMLQNLAQLLNMAKCSQQLAVFFSSRLETLIEDCVYNIFDLERFIWVMPEYFKQIMQSITSHPHQMQRIINADSNPDKTLEKITNTYPDYAEAFVAAKELIVKKCGI